MVGDVLSIDTASVTGESLPRNYPSDQYGTLILTGTTVKAGEAYCVVKKTGINTEVQLIIIPMLPFKFCLANFGILTTSGTD